MSSLLTILLAWLGVNALHGAWVGVRRRCWEHKLRRGADGLLPGAEAYTLGDGPVAILFIHGFADTPFIWRRIAARLAATGRFTCRALRLPGSGEPAAAAKQQSLALWRGAVDGELAHLNASHRAVWIAGHSLGAALAFDAALRGPERVAGVIAYAPLVEVSRRRSPLLPPALWFRLARVALGLSPTFESCFSAQGQAADDPSFTYVRDRFIPFCVYRALFALTRANLDKAARLKLPVFAVAAERDAVVDTPAALHWLARCPGPVELRVLAEAGHVVPLETGWEEVTDALASFVLAREPRGGA